MKATQFIKDHGLEKAREVVEGAPEHAFGYDFIDDDYFDGSDIQDGYSIDQCDGCLCVDELKRLLGSVDLIKWHGGIKFAKGYLKRNEEKHSGVTGWDELKQAIADYESIYGEE